MSSWRKNATACKNSGSAMSPLVRRAARSSVAIVDMCSIGFMGSSNPALNLTLSMTSSRPERGQLKSANIETRESGENHENFPMLFTRTLKEPPLYSTETGYMREQPAYTPLKGRYTDHGNTQASAPDTRPQAAPPGSGSSKAPSGPACVTRRQ